VRLIARKTAILPLLLIVIAAGSACARAPELALPGPLDTSEMREFLRSDAGKKYLGEGVDSLIEEAHRNQDDPALQAFYPLLKSKDYAAARAAVTRPAQAGHSQAQAELASMYLMGQGMPADIDAAITWYEKSAKQGNLQAMSTLGGIYANAQFGRQDLDKSYSWLQACALRLRATCTTNFAAIHLAEGTKFYSPPTAAAWFEIGVDRKAPGAVENRDALVAQLSPEELVEAKRLRETIVRQIATQTDR
jgi:TPR repeat protein